MKLTGQILKENRERKGKSITEVAIATKINSKIIIAMEEGDTDILPTKTFLRGFVRSYAVYLGIDVEATLRTFQEEMGTTKPGPINSATSPSSSSSGGNYAKPANSSNSLTPPPSRSNTQAVMQRAENQPMFRLILGIGVVILVILIFFIKQKMDSYERESIVPPTATVGLVPANPVPLASPSPSLEAVNPAVSASPSPAVAANPTAAANSAPPASATPLPNAAAQPAAPTLAPAPAPAAQPTAIPKPVPTVTAKPSALPSAVSTAAPSVTQKISPTPKPSPTPTATPTPAAKPSPTPKPSPSPKASPSPKPSPSDKIAGTDKSQDVILEALNTVNVEATVDGEKIKFTLRPDEIYNLKAKSKIVLQLSDGGAINLIVNGVDRGVPGDLGKPKKLELK